MKKSNKESLPYPQKLVMVFIIITALVLPIAISACPTSAVAETVSETTSGSLGQRLMSREKVLNITLSGVTSYELMEIFNEVIENTPGVVRAERYNIFLNPKHPKACQVEWQVTFNETTPFAIESAIYNRLKKMAEDHNATYSVNGYDITLTKKEHKTLQAIRPHQSTSRSICFIDTETFTNPRNEYQPSYRRFTVNRWSDYRNHGFE